MTNATLLEIEVSSDELIEARKLFLNKGFEPGLGIEEKELVLALVEKHGVHKTGKILRQLKELTENN